MATPDNGVPESSKHTTMTDGKNINSFYSEILSFVFIIIISKIAQSAYLCIYLL